MKFEIFTHMPYRVYIRNSKSCLVYANELASELLGVDSTSIIGEKYENIFNDESFINHLKKLDKVFFSGELESFTTIKEYNHYYKKPTIFKIIDYIYKHENEDFIVTILVELSDSYCIEKGLELSNIGQYDPANRIIKLNSGSSVCLTKLENSCLFLLHRKKGEVVGYDELFLTIDPFNNMDKISLKSLIYRLKKKLDSNIIENISMCGYRLNIN